MASREEIYERLLALHPNKVLSTVEIHYPKLTDAVVVSQGSLSMFTLYRFLKQDQGICPVCGDMPCFRNFRKGFTEFCSRECAAKSPKTRNKTRKTLLRTYGADHPMHVASIKRRQQKTNLRKYGSGNPLTSPDVALKAKATMLRRYGVDHQMKSPELVRKHQASVLRKYGVGNVSQDPAIFKKILDSTYHRKDVTIAGHAFRCQGYEPQAIQWLVNAGVAPSEIIGCPEAGSFVTNKGGRYFPDLRVEDLYIEVKSVYTSGLTKHTVLYNKMKARARSIIDTGAEFLLMVMSEQGQLLTFCFGLPNRKLLLSRLEAKGIKCLRWEQFVKAYKLI